MATNKEKKSLAYHLSEETRRLLVHRRCRLCSHSEKYGRYIDEFSRLRCGYCRMILHDPTYP